MKMKKLKMNIIKMEIMQRISGIKLNLEEISLK